MQWVQIDHALFYADSVPLAIGTCYGLEVVLRPILFILLLCMYRLFHNVVQSTSADL
jgi:hypothetical protein